MKLFTLFFLLVLKFENGLTFPKKTGILRSKGIKALITSKSSNFNSIKSIVLGTIIGFSTSYIFPFPSFALEQQYKLPPIDRSDKFRCELKSSSMGQANAARDKLYDLRECDLKGQVFSLT